jgi:hypothetical protein
VDGADPLYAHFRETFRDVRDVYRVKENVLARLRRDAELFGIARQRYQKNARFQRLMYDEERHVYGLRIATRTERQGSIDPRRWRGRRTGDGTPGTVPGSYELILSGTEVETHIQELDVETS